MKNNKFIFLLIVFIILEIVLIGARGVWAPDETRYARVASEMKEKGSFLIPYLNGEVYKEKPPLFFDITILFSIFDKGVPPYAVKIVSLLSSLVVILLAAALASRFGLKNLLLIPLIVLADVKFLWQSQFGQIDMLLCALIYGSLYIGYLTLESKHCLILNYLLLSFLLFLSIFAKGAAGVIPVFLTLLVFSFFRNNIKRGLNLFFPLLLCLIFVGIWLYISGLLAGLDYPKTLLFKQTLTRYLDPWHHYAPWYYYLGVMWGDGFPMIFLIIPAIYYIIKTRGFRKPQYLLALLFIVIYIVFFSASSGKRSVYILPIYPMVSFIIAFFLEEIEGNFKETKKIVPFLAIVPLVSLTASFVVLKKSPPQFFNSAIIVVIGLIILMLFSTLSILFIYKKKQFVCGYLTMGVFFLFLLALPILKNLDSVKVPYDLVRNVKPFLENGLKLGVYPSLIPSLNYYLDSNTPVFKKDNIEEARRFLNEGNFLLIEKDQKIISQFMNSSSSIWEGEIGDSTFLLLTQNLQSEN